MSVYTTIGPLVFIFPFVVALFNLEHDVENIHSIG